MTTAVPPPALPSEERMLVAAWVQLLVAGLPQLRALRHWTQQDLAVQSGLHRETIGRLERLVATANRPSDATLQALASAFGYSRLSDLWTALEAVVAATAPALRAVHLTSDVQQLVHAYLDCSAEQQQYVRGLVTMYAARWRAAQLGQTALIEPVGEPDLHPVTEHGSTARGRRR